MFRYLKYGKAITKADSEPKTNKNVDKNSLAILPAKTGIIYFTSLYLSVITDKIKVLTPNEDIRTITKIKNERIFFPIRKTDGRRKNIIIYQLGVSRKKQDLIILVSTAADSRAATQGYTWTNPADREQWRAALRELVPGLRLFVRRGLTMAERDQRVSVIDEVQRHQQLTPAVTAEIKSARVDPLDIVIGTAFLDDLTEEQKNAIVEQLSELDIPTLG